MGTCIFLLHPVYKFLLIKGLQSSWLNITDHIDCSSESSKIQPRATDDIFAHYSRPNKEKRKGLKNFFQKTHQVCTSEGKELIGARVVHLGNIKLLLGLDVSLLDLDLRASSVPHGLITTHLSSFEPDLKLPRAVRFFEPGLLGTSMNSQVSPRLRSDLSRLLRARLGLDLVLLGPIRLLRARHTSIWSSSVRYGSFEPARPRSSPPRSDTAPSSPPYFDPPRSDTAWLGSFEPTLFRSDPPRPRSGPPRSDTAPSSPPYLDLLLQAHLISVLLGLIRLDLAPSSPPYFDLIHLGLDLVLLGPMLVCLGSFEPALPRYGPPRPRSGPPRSEMAAGI
uniref:Uncharacterized protein n=1 Tax=Fagus sylvatica TaxID=28930 RepID=A0A2N9EVA9_FAGSY